MNKLQVNHTHYNQNYDNLFRFIDYYTQISLIKECLPENILEIGVGNKTVSNYLKNAGYTLTTLDFDRKLNPDIVGDITNIPLKKDSYKLVSACEVLEHLPWEQFEKALMEIARVSKKHVIISIPYDCFHFEIIFRIPFLTKYFKNKFFHYKLLFPKFYKNHKFPTSSVH